MLKDLQHPNIIRFIECYATKKKLCIIMEYADGK
ncbi:MAG: hypothetical protein ACKO96_35675 [Flammeovirgaceae bacterium]